MNHKRYCSVCGEAFNVMIYVNNSRGSLCIAHLRTKYPKKYNELVNWILERKIKLIDTNVGRPVNPNTVEKTVQRSKSIITSIQNLLRAGIIKPEEIPMVFRTFQKLESSEILKVLVVTEQLLDNSKQVGNSVTL